MPKTYPWQRWVDKKKPKGKSNFHGQTKESSWRESSINQVKNEAGNSRIGKRVKHMQEESSSSDEVVS